MIRVYFEKVSGAIVGHDIGNAEPFLQHGGHDYLELERGRPDHRLHVVDLASRQLRDMTPAERIAAQVPTAWDVRAARYHELKEFDWRENHAGWAAHRQALRDITTHGDPIEMVRRWPLRPDGSDAIPHLRKRLPENN